MKKTIIKILIAAGILTFILFRVGIAEIAIILSTINPLFLLLAYLTLFTILILNALNLKILFSPLKHLNFKKILKNYSLSWSLGFLTPGKLGEFSLVYFLRDIPLGKSSAVIVLEKLITILILISFSLIGIFFFLKTPTIPFLILIFLLLSMIFIIFSSFARGLVKRFVLRGHSSLFKGFSDTLLAYIKNRKKFLVSNAFFAGVRWFLFTSLTLFLFSGLNQEISFFALMTIVSLSSLVSMIPISISGLGLREGTFILLCSQIGIPVITSAAVSILSLILSYSVVFVIFVFLLRKTDFPNFRKFSASLYPKDVDSP